MKTWYNSHRWRRAVLFPLVTFAACGWTGRSCHTFSAFGGSLIRPQVSPEKGGESSSGRDSCNCRLSAVFSGGVSAHPITHWCLSPSLTPPRGKERVFPAKSRCGFPEQFASFVNPYLTGKRKGYKSACSVPRLFTAQRNCALVNAGVSTLHASSSLAQVFFSCFLLGRDA